MKWDKGCMARAPSTARDSAVCFLVTTNTQASTTKVKHVHLGWEAQPRLWMTHVWYRLRCDRMHRMGAGRVQHLGKVV